MPELNDEMVVILAAAVGVAVIAGLLVLSRMQGGRRLHRLAPAFEFGTARGSGLLLTPVVGLFQGYRCAYRVEGRSQYSPGGAVIRVPVSALHRWSAVTSSPASGVLVRLGLLADCPVGDEELDRLLRFSAGEESVLLAEFGSRAVRQATLRLARLENFESVTVRRDRFEVKWRPASSRLDDSPEALRTRLEASVGLIGALGYPPALG